VPRRINLLCGRALLGAYAHGLGSVTRPVVDKAAAEVFETEAPAAGPWRPTLAWMAAGGVAALLVLVVLGIWAWPGGGMGGRGVAGASSGVALGSASGAMPGIAASGAAAPASRASAAGVVASGPAAIGTGPAAGAAADWAALARLWGASAGAAPACEAAVAPPLACHRVDNASLAVLRKLDRPGVVTLRGSDGTERPAVLASLSRREAVVEVAGARQALGLKEFARRWRGDFTTLWRMPPGYSGKLVEGASGPAMDWMAAQLAAAQGASAPASAQALDAGWKARLVAFQRAQGVPADGRAGPVTFMQLNRASGVAEPRLAAQGS
jgi:general secretion pathway protein A